MDIILWYFELWVLSEPNPNLNGYLIEPEIFNIPKGTYTKHDFNSQHFMEISSQHLAIHADDELVMVWVVNIYLI